MGVKVGPWLIAKPGHAAQANLGGISRTWNGTGKDGLVTLDWLPAHVTGKISIMAHSADWYSSDNATWIDPEKPVDEVTITQLPYERLSGRIATADGQPVSGVSVMVEGQGSGNNGFRGGMVTGADGRYSLRVYSEQAYIVTATKGDMAAPYKSGVVVRAGRPVERLDMTLARATRVKGRVTVGKDHQPVAETSVQAVIDKGSIPEELKRRGRPLVSRHESSPVETDRQARRI